MFNLLIFVEPFFSPKFANLHKNLFDLSHRLDLNCLRVHDSTM